VTTYWEELQLLADDMVDEVDLRKPTLYSPLVIQRAHVVFAPGHPGSDDPGYRRHRSKIASAALNYRSGDPAPHIRYTAEEDAVWRRVRTALVDRHHDHVCAELRDSDRRLGLPTERVPQLAEVSAALEELTGFRIAPTAGLAPLRAFYSAFADGVFHATQFLRHHSSSHFSPEPDMLHEVLGHGPHLASPRFAALYRLAGETAQRLETVSALQTLSRVFWFTMESGVMRESGALKAYGAAILSSPSELENVPSAAVRPLSLEAITAQDYDVTSHQSVLFAADSMEHLEDFLGEFLTNLDDYDTPGWIAA
jgi:phenylalanine-4-hydroxylase